MYNTENDFSTFLTAKLSKLGMRATRLESHSTSNGIPDMFVDGYGFDTFIELKNDKKHSINDKVIKVQWRPGQQPWMYEYFLKHKHSKCCLTIIACTDGWFVIPMTKVYKDNIVYNANNFGISYKDLKRVTIGRLIHLMSTHFALIDTYRNAIIAMVNKFWRFSDGTTVDYDPEVLWNSKNVDDEFSSDVFESAKLEMFLTLENTLKNVDQTCLTCEYTKNNF